MDTSYAYFAEVARQGSIRQAAERLNISASSISRQIIKLEHDLGVPLLARHAQGVKLTAAGEIVAEFVHSRHRELARLRARVDELKRLERGHVSLYTVEGMLGGFLPRAIADFSRRHPALTYEVVIAGADDVMRAVADDRCDLGIAFQPKPRADVEIVGHMAQPVLAVVTPEHPLAREESLSIADLVAYPVGLPDPSFGIRHIVDLATERAAIELQLRLETNSIEMVRQFALFGMGVAFLPEFAFQREAAAGSLIGIRLIETELASATTQFCKHGEFDLTWAARSVLEALVEASDQMLVLR
ncbi:LysR family transcriptional regulator [Afifella pfennigii]|uniref:LysR family transcriptional regulator n=1 Tax=Afifella pfennigii TaxID=209897 RepID=UPI00047E8A46|nr:LysR family transcriptional regulator [Afifella pfennigii]